MIFLMFFAVGSAVAQSSAKAAGVDQEVLSQIPQRMKSFIDRRTVAGAVTLVANGSDIVEFDATGMADIEADHPMRKDTIFQIMSMTKPVTAAAAMILVEEGKIGVTDLAVVHFLNGDLTEAERLRDEWLADRG